MAGMITLTNSAATGSIRRVATFMPPERHRDALIHEDFGLEVVEKGDVYSLGLIAACMYAFPNWSLSTELTGFSRILGQYEAPPKWRPDFRALIRPDVTESSKLVTII